MKRYLVTLVVFLSVLGNFAFAKGDEIVNIKIRDAFRKEFSSAQQIHWEKIKNENIYEAQFIYNNERLCAFFDENGQLLVISRSIAAASLPMLVTKKVNKQYKDYKLQEVLEYVCEGNTSYVLVLEKDSVRVVIQAYPEGSVSIFKKEKIK
jgi:hypothetical protein